MEGGEGGGGGLCCAGLRGAFGGLKFWDGGGWWGMGSEGLWLERRVRLESGEWRSARLERSWSSMMYDSAP